MKKLKDKKISFAAVFFAGLFFAFGIFSPVVAQADVLDFLKGLFTPFFGSFTATTSRVSSTIPRPPAGMPPTSLYKPVIDYERAVVAAVKKASPAVVSITVS